MLESYKIITVTHHNAHLQALGNYMIASSDPVEQRQSLESAARQLSLSELFYLATCNRIMILTHTEAKIDLKWCQQLFELLNSEATADVKHLVIYEGEEAIRHLFEVASSLDSMVIGERQIVRQLRDAYEKQKEWGLTGDHIRIAIQSAIKTAKKVYSNTRIGEKKVSVVSVAMDKLLSTGIRRDAKVLLVGAGKTNTLVSKFLQKHGFEKVTVFNRDEQKARKLAAPWGGNGYHLSELENYTGGFDCLISCTSSPDPVIDVELLDHLTADDPSRKIIVDLAIPHNVAEKVATDTRIKYIQIEDLREEADKNHEFRVQEVLQAKEIIADSVEEFHTLFHIRKIERAFSAIPREIKAVKSKAIDEVFRKEFETLDDHSREICRKMLDYMEKKCIGIPMKAAKHAM